MVLVEDADDSEAEPPESAAGAGGAEPGASSAAAADAAEARALAEEAVAAEALPPGEDPEESKANALDKGKREYSAGNHEAAVKAWNVSMKSVRYILDKNLYKDKPEQLQEVHDMELKLNVNLAQGYLKTGEFNKAIESADKALARDPANAKALYRKASAHMSLLNFAEAEEVLSTLLEAEPANAAAKALLAEAQRSAKVSERRAKQMSRKMFEGMAGDGARGAAPARARGGLLDYAASLLRVDPSAVPDVLRDLPARCVRLCAAASEAWTRAMISIEAWVAAWLRRPKRAKAA